MNFLAVFLRCPTNILSQLIGSKVKGVIQELLEMSGPLNVPLPVHIQGAKCQGNDRERKVVKKGQNYVHMIIE